MTVLEVVLQFFEERDKVVPEWAYSVDDMQRHEFPSLLDKFAFAEYAAEKNDWQTGCVSLINKFQEQERDEVIAAMFPRSEYKELAKDGQGLGIVALHPGKFNEVNAKRYLRLRKRSDWAERKRQHRKALTELWKGQNCGYGTWMVRKLPHKSAEPRNIISKQNSPRKHKDAIRSALGKRSEGRLPYNMTVAHQVVTYWFSRGYWNLYDKRIAIHLTVIFERMMKEGQFEAIPVTEQNVLDARQDYLLPKIKKASPSA